MMTRSSTNAQRPESARLAQIVYDELTFYRQLFHLADRQRDALRADTDVRACDIYDQIHTIQRRIEDSERALRRLRAASPAEYEHWIRMPQVAANLRNIVELVERTQEVITDCVRLAGETKARYRSELSRMGTGRLLLASMGNGGDTPRFVDHRK